MRHVRVNKTSPTRWRKGVGGGPKARTTQREPWAHALTRKSVAKRITTKKKTCCYFWDPFVRSSRLCKMMRWAKQQKALLGAKSKNAGTKQNVLQKTTQQTKQTCLLLSGSLWYSSTDLQIHRFHVGKSPVRRFQKWTAKPNLCIFRCREWPI